MSLEPVETCPWHVPRRETAVAICKFASSVESSSRRPSLWLTDSVRAQPNPDVLGLTKGHQALRPQFTTESRELPASERRLQLRRIVDVDPNSAGFQTLRERPMRGPDLAN